MTLDDAPRGDQADAAAGALGADEQLEDPIAEGRGEPGTRILDQDMPACLAYLETVVPDTGYLVGDSLSIADLAVTTCFIQARYGDYDVDGSAAQKLRHYLDRAYAAELVTRRPAAEQAALPPGLA